jgi:arylsulfatase A-like enzyme
VERNTLRYLDGLELVDHTIAQIRRTLESVGLWDRTHLIVSSDHPARSRERIDGISNDRRVPFIVRVAGTSQEIAYKPVFNTIVSSDLAIALLRGEIHSPAEVRSKIEDDAGAGRP